MENGRATGVTLHLPAKDVALEAMESKDSHPMAETSPDDAPRTRKGGQPGYVNLAIQNSCAKQNKNLGGDGQTTELRSEVMMRAAGETNAHHKMTVEYRIVLVPNA